MNNKPSSINLKLDLRIICILLILVIAGMLAFWRPWQADASDGRKITISGEATVKAEPDEYQFSPTYERKTTAETTQVSKDITAKLKELGVEESQIKVDASRYRTFPSVEPVEPDKPATETTTLSMTILVSDKDLAQKVQDYLLTTNPSGSVTPYPTFSKEKQKELEDRAREEAIADAKKRAENTASGFGASLGKVVEVQENDGYGIMPLISRGAADIGVESKDSSLPLQPGENEFTYRLSVVFSLK